MMYLGSNVIRFNKLPSTNDYLKDNYRNLAHGTVVRALTQTHGKGRFSRSWHSGEDLLFSLLIKENIKLSEVSQLGLVAAAAVFDTLKKYVVRPLIKWPNDILVEGKKITGILLESVIENNRLNCLVIGIGLNVNTVNYPPELINKSTSLRLITGNVYDVDNIYDKLIQNFNGYYIGFKADNKSYARICAENSALTGKDVVFQDNGIIQTGRVIGILENGNILIETAEGQKEYNSGEITLHEYYEQT